MTIWRLCVHVSSFELEFLKRYIYLKVSPKRFSLPILFEFNNKSNIKTSVHFLIYNWTIVFNPLFYQVLDRRPPRLVVCRHETDCISFESIESFQQEVLMNLYMYLVSGNIRLSIRVYWWFDSSLSDNSMVRYFYIQYSDNTAWEKLYTCFFS